MIMTHIPSVRYLAVLFVAAFSLLSTADEKSDAIDKIYKEWDSTHSPGASVAVFQDGKMVFARGYGMANLEHGITLKPNSVFRIASTSKQFTAACIAILSLRGKLDLDAGVREYIPELSEIYQPVTVRHMVHHTSGIRDYLALQRLRGIGDDEYYTADDVLDVLTRQKALNFPAGEQYLYSNSGYFLLGVVVERVSGKNMADYARENIFEPLGMKNTHFHNDCSVVVPNRATGYGSDDQGEFYIEETILDIIGDGGIFTTVEDMFLWDRNFYDNKLDYGLIDLILTAGVLNSGEEIDYAFALRHGNYRGLKTVAHGGAFVGFRAQMMRFPEQHFTVVCFCNYSSLSVNNLCQRVADVYLSDVIQARADTGVTEETSTAEKVYVTLPDARLKELAGHYRSGDGDRICELRPLEDGILWVDAGDEIEMKPISENEFYGTFYGIDIEFLFDDSSFHLKISGRDRGQLHKFEPFAPTPTQLAEYAGDYYSEELDVTYRIEVVDNELHTRARNVPDDPLRPALEDEFNLNALKLLFQRAEDGMVSGFTISAGRVKGILFEKK